MGADELHHDIIELLPAYALGCLDEDEMILVAEYLAHSPAGRAELQTIQAVADRLALAAPEATPPAALKQRLFERLQLSPPPDPVRSPLSWWPKLRRSVRYPAPRSVWSLAIGLLLLLLVAGALLLWPRPGPTVPAPMQALPLAATGRVPAASGFLLISADGLSGAVVVDELPMLEPEQEYQLWLLGADHPAAAALFSVDELGYGGSRVQAPRPIFDYSSAEITIEPAGGSDYPTGEAVLMVTGIKKSSW